MPRIGRWASPDPLWIHAQGGGEALNAFHYVSGNLLQARDPLGLNTVWLGGAGEEEDTAAYSEPIVEKMSQAGVPEPKYVPVGQPGGKPQNIAWTMLNRETPRESTSSGKSEGNAKVTDRLRGAAEESGLVQDTETVIEPAVSASNTEGGTRNFVGYSYGSVVAAHSALRIANNGGYVDNVILVGSPIASESDLYKELQNNKNIGEVTRIDIKDDPVSDGISPKLWNIAEHFYYTTNDEGQQDRLANTIAETIRVNDPGNNQSSAAAGMCGGEATSAPTTSRSQAQEER